MLACDLALNPDTGMLAPHLPTITYGLRGLAYFEIRLNGPAHDLHSGVFGGVVHNPAQVLCELIASLHDEQGRVTLPGFLPRLVQVDLVSGAASDPSAPVFTLTLTALDGLPLAALGSFTLTAGPVVLPDISAVAFNVPLFPSSALTVVKVADRSHVRIGETVGYRVLVGNPGILAVSGVTLTDLLPEFLDPVEGASRRIVDGTATREREGDERGGERATVEDG